MVFFGPRLLAMRSRSERSSAVPVIKDQGVTEHINLPASQHMRQILRYQAHKKSYRVETRLSL